MTTKACPSRLRSGQGSEPPDVSKGPVLLLGGGGHATVLWEVLSLLGRDVLGFVDPAPPADLALSRHECCLGGDAAVLGYGADAVALVNGVGSTASTLARRAVYQRFAAEGYHFASLVHPSAVCSGLDMVFGAGVQILAGAVIGPGVRLGDNVLINNRAVIEHDCVISAHCHVASGAVLCGGVTLGEGVHVGASATVIQGIMVGDGAIIAAGAVVIHDLPPACLVAGVPARIKRVCEL